MILRDDKYIVPEALQKPVIKLYHDYAHVSAPKTQQLIQKNFWWPQMASDIQRWCDTCIVCATINQGKPGRTKLCRPEPPKGPWELLQLDFIGPLPSAKGGYRYCLVIIDKFSKWVEAIPTRNNSANTVARVVANQILPLWGAPIQIESDQGTHNGIDPKLCYYVKNLEPATYRCTHTETHNDTHIRFTELMYDLTSYTPNETKPKTFVWTNRKEGMYCVGECSHSIDNFTNPHNCSWTVKYCFNLTTCGYTKPKKCRELHSIPPGGLIRGNINKTLLHDVNLVMTHVTYNISNILSAYTKHCNTNDESHAWLQSRIDDLISDYKDRLAVQIPPARSKRDLLSSIAGLFGSINSAANTYKITKQSQFSTWLTDQMATGFQHITNSNDNIIKAVRSEAQALLTISHTLFNQTRTIECDLACRSYAQDLFTATRQEILDLRLHKTPRHVLNDLIEVLDLHRWFSSEKMDNVKYSELLSTIMMYTGNECIGCIGFFATFPLIHPDQVYPNSTNIRSIGMVVKDQVIKWDHLTGYMTL